MPHVPHVVVFFWYFKNNLDIRNNETCLEEIGISFRQTVANLFWNREKVVTDDDVAWVPRVYPLEKNSSSPFRLVIQCPGHVVVTSELSDHLRGRFIELLNESGVHVPLCNLAQAKVLDMQIQFMPR